MGWNMIDLDERQEVVIMLTVRGRKMSFTPTQLAEALERKDLGTGLDPAERQSLSSLAALTRELKRRIDQKADTTSSERNLALALSTAGLLERPARPTAKLGLMLEDCYKHVGGELQAEIKKFLRTNKWLVDDFTGLNKK